MEATAREKLLEAIRNDLKAISVETKRSKSFQPVRESTDEAVSRIRTSWPESGQAAGCGNMFLVANQILYPLGKIQNLLYRQICLIIKGVGYDTTLWGKSRQVLQTFISYSLVQGCETKDTKLVRMCLALMQRLVTNKVIDFKGARYITDTLWMLMESTIEVCS
jgi:hypothetical protein